MRRDSTFRRARETQAVNVIGLRVGAGWRACPARPVRPEPLLHAVAKDMISYLLECAD